MSTPEQRAAEERRARAAALAVGGGLVLAQTPTPPVGDVLPQAARAAAAGAILSALVGYLVVQRARMRAWLTEQVRRRTPAAGVDDIERVLVGEEQRGAEFERRQAERLARDVTTALAIPDPAAREGAVRGLLAREQRYTRQREEAMAARAFAAVDRVVLRGQSPSGAFWKLDPTVIEHTAGCLIMGGRFWPWAVLDRVHPPRHAGCPCRLVGYGEAIADGLLDPAQVMDVNVAIRRAAAVVMEGALVLDDEDAARQLVEAGEEAERQQILAVLVEAGLTTAEECGAVVEDWRTQPRDPGGEAGGRWVKGAGAAAGAAGGADPVAKARALFEGIDPGAKVTVATARQGDRGIVVHGTLGQAMGKWHRIVNFDTGTVDHALLNLSMGLRGKGVGTSFARQSFDAYRKAGLKRVTVAASADHGGYVWAREGFEFDTSHASPQEQIDLMLESEVWVGAGADARKMTGVEKVQQAPVPQEVRDAFLAELRSGSITSPAYIAAWGRSQTWEADGQTWWLGKWLLTGQGWMGVLEL